MFDILIHTLAFIFGALIGSFLNVVILRYISHENFVKGRSKCLHCQKTLRWWELLPVFSYVFLRGHCARCQKKISAQYPLVELAMGLITLLIVLKIPAFAGMTTDVWVPAFAGMTAVLIFALLIVLFVIDLYTFLLPDVFVAILMALVAIKLFVSASITLDTIYGMLVGPGFLLFLWLITRGKGIGLGDVKLMLPLGALFGLWGVITLLFLSFMCGGVVGVVLLIRHKAKLQTQIPFGPFLTGTGIILLLFPSIINWFAFTLGFYVLF